VDNKRLEVIEWCQEKKEAEDGVIFEVEKGRHVMGSIGGLSCPTS